MKKRMIAVLREMVDRIISWGYNNNNNIRPGGPRHFRMASAGPDCGRRPACMSLTSPVS